MKDFKVGIALGSGAARGMAHIGVLDVLTRAGIPIHYVAGSSMGSVVGGLFCSGMKLSYMERIANQIDRNLERRYYDISLPITRGLIKGQRIEKLIRTLCGNRRIEDLPLPFTATACCLETAQLVHFDEGDLTQAIRASVSIPGIFEPVVIDGKTYVDAGFMQRVPVEVLREKGMDYVIGVDVGYRGGPNKTPGSVLDLLFMYYDMVEWQVVQHGMRSADFLISVNTRKINPANFHQAAECIALGREEAGKHVEAIKKDLIRKGLDPSVFQQNQALAEVASGPAGGAPEGGDVDVCSPPVQ